jgi:PTS system cellobiose-specific IIC component
VTLGSYLLMDSNVIHKPFVNVPGTTPPVLGQYLVTGGDWKATAERRRMQAAAVAGI